MLCPKCSNEMVQVLKHGVSIDTCAACGGVGWTRGNSAS